MKTPSGYSDPEASWPRLRSEISGRSNTDALDTADAAIRRIMVAQKRELSRKKLPDLDPE